MPEYIDPLQLADKRGSLKGQISLNSLDRLKEGLSNDEGCVDIELFFGREGRLAKIEGQIKTILSLECQNCLQALELSVDSVVKLGIVSSIDEANRLPDDYEPLLVEQENISLKTLIEDELLLILPAFPKHEHNCFIPYSDNNKSDSSLVGGQSTIKSPFSILAKLKTSGDL
ncbi:YceD family protein [Candidatus Methylobacter favarea]|uniref:YceD family protein n=1 Tax=Candidatus Methylobacter favarea TaxID=2707345 RepID=UPI001FE50F09|nr:YceD family protein [Candidatus Methylobacter favarea]